LLPEFRKIVLGAGRKQLKTSRFKNGIQIAIWKVPVIIRLLDNTSERPGKSRDPARASAKKRP